MSLVVRKYEPPHWDSNTHMLHEIWKYDAASDPVSASPARQASYKRPERYNLAFALESRGQALHHFELEKSLKSARSSSPSSPRLDKTSKVQADADESAPSPRKMAADEKFDADNQLPWEQTLRPAFGSGYNYSTYSGKRATLAEHFRGPAPRENIGMTADVEESVGSRRERIEALEKGILAHDEYRLRQIGIGTTPLLGPNGPLPLPVPPLEETVEVHQQLKRRLIRQRVDCSAPCSQSADVSAEHSLRSTLAATKILGADARENPDLSAVGPQSKWTAGVEQRGLPNASSPRQVGGMSPEMAWAKTRSLGELLQEAESLVQTGAKDDYWVWVAFQLCAKAYEASSTDVLRMVRTTGAAAHIVRTARSKRELLRAAEHLLSALSSRMHKENLEFLCEVLEAMSDASVGTQIYLDMIMAQLLSHHHRDCQALQPRIALRVASALGRLAQSLRLRPQGVGGPSTSTNSKFVDILQRRLADRAADCAVEDLACLDGYYLTRLCGEKTRQALVIRMAELQIGLREASKQYLPFMLRLAQTIKQELSDAFRWSVPPKARDYLTQLQEMALGQAAPWTRGVHGQTAFDLRRKLERMPLHK